MSERFFFLFAALGALGGLATFADVALRVSDRLLGRGRRKVIAQSDDPLTIDGKERSGLRISKTRYAVVILLLGVSAALSIAGFISSARGEDPLKVPLQPENVEGTLRGWLDHFQIATQKAETPGTLFSLVATVQDVPVLVFRKKPNDQYVVLQARVELGPEHKARLQKLSQDEVARLNFKLIGEMARAKISTIIDGPVLSTITVVDRIPVTNSLTEDAFIHKLDEIVFAVAVVRATITLELEERKPQ